MKTDNSSSLKHAMNMKKDKYVFVVVVVVVVVFFFFGPEHNLSRCYSKIAVHWFIHVLTAATCFSDNNVCSTH